AAASSLMDGWQQPARIGRMLFDVYFVLLIGITLVATPLYAATSITSERESKTFETLILSGMSPEQIAKGKLTSTLSAFGLVVVAVSPPIGLCFLFGGVSPVEALLGFFYVACLALPAAAFGVAMSARFETTRASVLATLAVGFFFAPFVLMPALA